MLYIFRYKNKCKEIIIEWKYCINIMLYRELDLKNMISKYNKYRNIFLDIIIMLYMDDRYFKIIKNIHC